MTSFNIEKAAKGMVSPLGQGAREAAPRVASRFYARGDLPGAKVWTEIAMAINRQQQLRAAIDAAGRQEYKPASRNGCIARSGDDKSGPQSV